MNNPETPHHRNYYGRVSTPRFFTKGKTLGTMQIFPSNGTVVLKSERAEAITQMMLYESLLDRIKSAEVMRQRTILEWEVYQTKSHSKISFAQWQQLKDMLYEYHARNCLTARPARSALGI